MSRYKVYPEYKDSGVKWLGETPDYWRIYQIKRSLVTVVNGIWGSDPKGEDDTIVLRVADFNRETLRIDDNNLTFRFISVNEKKNRLLIKNDLLIEKSGGGEKQLVGCVVLFDKDFVAVTSNFVARIRPLGSVNSGFLCYAFHHLYEQKVNYCSIKQTTGIQNLDSEQYLVNYFSFPPIIEQLSITLFLDYETSKIDQLINKQKALIELLKEKRQALISQAVTKGLNPHVKMKDSGIEWLGKVPEHWKLIKLSYVLKLQSGNTITSDSIEFEGEYPVYGGNGLRGYTETYNCEGIYILIGRQGALCGNINIAKGKFFASEHALVVYPLQKIDTDYISNLLGFMNLGQYSVSAAQPGISVERINLLPLLLPPLAEQIEIADYVNKEILKIKKLIEKATKAVNLLQERRTALISAAVTGKIDVRDWQSPNAIDTMTKLPLIK